VDELPCVVASDRADVFGFGRITKIEQTAIGSVAGGAHATEELFAVCGILADGASVVSAVTLLHR